MQVDVNLKLLLGNSRILRRQIKLLKAVDRTKSITEAAREIGISYKNAWDSINEINALADEPLLVRASGNRKNSGSELSSYAKGLIATYERLSEIQSEVLKRVCEDGRLENFNEKAARGLEKIGLQISVTNQISVKITTILQDDIFAYITASLSNEEQLTAQINVASLKRLCIEVGDEVVFAFKASKVLCQKRGEVDLSKPNLTQNTLFGVVSEVKEGQKARQVAVKCEPNLTLYLTSTQHFCEGDEVEVSVLSDDIIICV